MKLAFSILTLLMLFFVGFETAPACSCKRPNPPCGGGKTSVIFTGEVASITEIPQGGNLVQFKVIESFNNIKSQTLIVKGGTGGGDCSYNFKVGEKYLVYGSEYERIIGTSICSRTSPLSNAQIDLEILRQIKSNQPVQLRLFGTLYLYSSETGSVNTIPKVKVTAKNEAGKIYETVSDETGNYRFMNLPFGKYNIQTAYKENFIKNIETVIKAAKAEQCAEKNFYFREGGSIRGRVVDNEGKPVAGLTVYAERLVFAPEEAKGSKFYDARTDENGNYFIEGLHKGKYILSINYDSSIPNDFPFPATFYPNAKTKEQAENILVTTEKPLTGYNIQLPPRLKLRTITGTAFFTNGKPIAGGRVEVRKEGDEWRRTDDNDIDKEGRFTLKVFEGQSYYLYVYKTWNISRESKKIYIPKTGEIEPLKIAIHPVQ